MSDEKKEQKAGDHITLRVCYESSDNAVSFKIKRSTKFGKLFKAYKERQGIQGSYRFRYNGDPLNEDDTPDGCAMEEEDQIEAYLEQTGGRS